MSSALRMLIEFGPLAAFFVTFKLFGLIPATGALIVATLLALIIGYIRDRKIAAMPLITGVMVTIFGGLTLYLQDETFIKIKPTIINMLFAVALLGGAAFKKPMLKYVLEYAIQMTGEGWLILSRRWGFFFLFLAALNEVIWRNFSNDFWVNFKVFGMFTATMLFTACQIPLMQKHAEISTENSKNIDAKK